MKLRTSRLLAALAALITTPAFTAPVSALQTAPEFDAISASPAGAGPVTDAAVRPSATSTSGPHALSAPACNNTPLNTQAFAGTTGPIFPTPTTPPDFTAVVSGAGTYLWDVNLNTTITHPNCGQLEIWLTSPAGTKIVISTQNGGGWSNVFNGTTWDDSIAGLSLAVEDHSWANNVTATPQHPEGRLSAFRGENPNGTWTLTVRDMFGITTGTLVAWSVDVTTIPTTPVPLVTTFSRSPNLVITSTGTPTVTDAMLVSGVSNYLSKVTLYVQLPHTRADDVNLRLTSPAGTQVHVTINPGTGQDNNFNGTLFDPGSTIAVSDYPFANNVTVPVLSPAGAFDPLLGQNPNGTWTLTVEDDDSGEGGTLVRWDLNIATIAPPSPSGVISAAGTTGAIPDHPVGAPVPTTYTALVSGVGSYLWDVDLTTFLRHERLADLDTTLTSPSGTTVTICTGGGGSAQGGFYGTVWDDNAIGTIADQGVDNLLLPTIAPEGRLGAFRGEDPNGTWTLTITDTETQRDDGFIDAWSLAVSALASVPNEVVWTYTQSPGIAISGSTTSTSMDTISIVGLVPFIKEIEVHVEIPHANANDLDITLTSPTGTVVLLTSDNGGLSDNVFNGTLFDEHSTDAITDYPFVSNVVVPRIAPEGGFDRFVGEDPDGPWTLTVVDDFGVGGGTFVRWSLTVRTCSGAGQAFCSSSTLGFDHVTSCPCGNTGAPANGCGHSFDPNGANLDATGSAPHDAVVLHSQFEPASSFTLFMQHANSGDAVFHDGVLCAGNPLIRLRGRSAVAGEAFFPNPDFAQDSTTTLSARGGTFPGSGATMRYAAWYRNASSTFCPPSTANVTNGWMIAW